MPKTFVNSNEKTVSTPFRGIGIFLRFLFCVLLAGGQIGSAFGSEEKDVLPFLVRQWTIENGLPQDRISCLKQTRDGYLWIGTWVGLARFDGTKFTVFKHGTSNRNELGMKDDCINALTEDAEGTLWIATKRGIILYRDGRFQYLKGPAHLMEEKVWALCPAKDGGVWFCTDDLLVHYREGLFKSSELPKNSGSKLTIRESPDGTLNLFHRQTWYTVAPGRMEVEASHVRSPAEKTFRTAVHQDEKQFWVGTANGLQLFDGEHLYPSPSRILATNGVNFLYRTQDGALWAETERIGLLHEEGNDFVPVELVKSRVKPSTICMENDSEGSVWVGTDVGLFQLQRPSVRTYTSADGLSSENVVSVCEDRDNIIWAATDYGVSRIVNGVAGSMGDLEPKLNLHSRCVWPKSDGSVWIGKQHGLVLQYSNGRFSELGSNAFPIPATPDSLYEDALGRLWVGSRLGALAFAVGRFEQPVISTAENGVREVRAILEDRKGTMWFGTKREGLVSLRDGKYSRFTTLNGLGDDRVWNIYEDARGTLWIGTGGGLTRYRNGKFFAYTIAHGLREDAVNCVLEDNFGYFWLSGLKGIYRIKRDDLEAVATGRSFSFPSITLGTVDGMESAETNGERQASGWKAHDGRLWFPTTQGLAVIDPKLVGQHTHEPRVVIEAVNADDQVIYDNTTFVMAPPVASASPTRISSGSGHVIEFTFTANTFSKPEKTTFRYRLVGVDSSWHDQIKERTVRYLNLRPGRYQFEVTARNRHGQWNEKAAVFPFMLDPKFWQTGAFYAACLAIVIGIIGGFHWYRLRWQKRLLILEQQRALANERARIARDLHDDLGTALTGLALELDVAGAGEHRANPETGRFSSAAQQARGLAQRMREVVWAINPRCDNTSSLSDFLEEQITHFLSNAGIHVRLDFPEDIPTIPMDAEARHQFALCVREALNNIVRHAGATLVNIRLEFSPDWIRLSIKDNGCGFEQVRFSGNGLSNIRARLEKISGTFECITVPGAGTEVLFTVPISRNLKSSERNTK